MQADLDTTVDYCVAHRGPVTQPLHDSKIPGIVGTIAVVPKESAFPCGVNIIVHTDAPVTVTCCAHQRGVPAACHFFPALECSTPHTP